MSVPNTDLTPWLYRLLCRLGRHDWFEAWQGPDATGDPDWRWCTRGCDREEVKIDGRWWRLEEPDDAAVQDR